VLVMLPAHDEQTAVGIVRLACRKLMTERPWPTDPKLVLSIAAGLVTEDDSSALPAKLRSDADGEQKRAKDRSRATAPRPSVIAIKGKAELIVIDHDDAVT
ncbi:MAG TPA: hypothetical protein VKE74_12525, partial [Gemmataceae bacterium]|nr:hypothetical protein [Gemmataceae bacterium]